MSKKVKWSVIGVTSAALLSFAGLITGQATSDQGKVTTNSDTAATNTEDQTITTDPSEDSNSDQSTQDTFGGSTQAPDSFPSEGRHRHGSQDSSSSWSDDEVVQAPSGGMEQGSSGSNSGSSK